MVIASDQQGKVWMIGSGTDASSIPSQWNGIDLTATVLTQDQEIAYNALPSDRGGLTFDGKSFTALPAAPKIVPEQTVTLSQLQAALSAAGLQAAQVTAAVSAATALP